MTDEELIAELRKPWFTNGCERYQLDAADRIEALVKADRAQVEVAEKQAETIIRINARAERLEAALREIESISVHSGGEVHGVTADHWKMAFEQAQNIARAALKGANN